MLRYFSINEDKPFHSLMKAIIFSVLFTLFVLFLIPIASGMLLTYFYAPDIANSFESIQYLQNEVSFGVVYLPVNSGIMILLSLILGLGLFGLISTVVKKYKKKK